MNMDERQLFIRGEAFKHGLLFMGIFVVVDAFLVDHHIHLVEGMWGNILLLALTSCVIYTEMIFRNAISYEDKRSVRLLSFLGCVGLILLVWGMIDILCDGIFLSNDYIIPKNIAELAMSVLWLWLGISFWVRKSRIRYGD